MKNGAHLYTVLLTSFRILFHGCHDKACSHGMLPLYNQRALIHHKCHDEEVSVQIQAILLNKNVDMKLSVNEAFLE